MALFYNTNLLQSAAMFWLRFVQLQAGLILYGVAIALMLRANLGLEPWGVFHEGVALRTGWSFGAVTIVVGALVLLLWLPLRQKPGVGTICNIVMIGLSVDASLWFVTTPDGYLGRFAMLTSGIVLCGAAAGAYIGAGLGPGPRDGLMTGLVRVTGLSIRLVRTLIELAVLAAGWLLGGTVGLGTVLFAVAIGWPIQFFLPIFTIADRPSRTRPARLGEEPI